MQARKLTLVEIGVGGLPSASPVAPRFSTWFPVPFKAPDVPPANGVNPTPVADGVVLEWDAVDLEGVIYVISRSESQDGPWTEIHRTTETRYVYSDGSGKTWWFQITPTVRGKTGTGTVVGVVPPTTSKDLAEQQAKLAAEISARIQAIADEAAARAAGLAQAAQDLVAEALLRQQGVTEAMQAISAEAQARIDALLNEKMAREAAISREEQLRQSADESLARALSEVAAGSGTQFDSIKLWPFNQTIEGWTGNGAPTLVDGWLRPANHATAPWVQSPVALAVDGSAYRFVKLRVKRVGSPTWNGFLQWITTTDQAWNTQKRAAIPEPAWDVNGVATVDVQDIAWWPATVDAIRLQLGAAQTVANYYLIDYIAVGRPQPGASVALVQEETQARITADAAEALQRNTLAVQMRGNYTGTDPLQLTAGLAYEELKARVAADSAQVQRISTMEARMPAGAGSLATAASVTALQEATATTTSALAQSITTINATLPALISQGSNMVLNGSWDQGHTVGWSYSNMGGVSIVAEGRNGKCLKVTAPSGSRSMTANGATDRNIPVVMGKKYRISAYYKTDAAYNGTSGNGKIRIANQDDGLIAGLAFAANRSEWTRLESTVTATTISALRVYVNSDHTAGTLWVDDVVLEEVTELLANAQAISDLSTSVTQLGDTLTSQAGQLTSLRSDLTSVSGKTDANASALQNLTTRVTTAEGKIDSTSTSITKLQSDLSTSILSGANLIQDGSFETRKAGDAYGIGRITDTFARSGTKALSLTATGAIRDVSLIEFRTNGSRVFYAEVWVRNDPANPLTIGSGDGTVGLQATIRRNNGTVGYPNVQVMPAQNLGAEWTKLSGYVLVGDDVWSFIVRATIRGGVASGNVIYDDAFVIDVTEAYTAQQGVDANASAVQGLTTRLTTAEGKITAQADAVTELQAGIGSIGGDNLLPNSSYEVSDSPIGAPMGYVTEGTMAATANSYVPSPLSGGGRAFRRVGRSAQVGQYIGLATPSNAGFLQVEPSNDYTLSTYVRGTPGAILRMYVQWRNAAGGVVVTTTTPDFTTTGQWQRAVFPVRTNQANVETARVFVGRLFSTAVSGATAEHFMELDNVQFQKGKTATEWAPSGMGVEAGQLATATALQGLTATVNQQGSKLDATAQDLVSLKTQVGDVSASGFNQLKTQVTQQGQTQASQAQQITGIQTSLGGKADAAVVVDMQAQVKNLGESGNLLMNTTFPFRQRTGWGWGENPGNGWTELGSSGADVYDPAGMFGLSARFQGTLGQSGFGWFGTEYDIPVEPGKFYCASAWINTHRCDAAVEYSFYGADGGRVGIAQSPWTGAVNAQAGQTLAAMKRPFAIVKAPATAVKARFRILLRGLSTAEANPYVWLYRPMVSIVAEGATQPPQWSAGGTESSASWGVNVRADGKIGGIQLASNGVMSAFDVVADIFRVSSPSGGQRTEYSDGNWRTYYPNGQLATRMGWWQ
ncbi:TPA: carbohydrate binding domain-containing protein [Stenotrophomonas maltophilia]|nr:carbohydrate binding domain-containing protein [Stenotrophomonas maltophilia]